jgi:hypothetical protein
MSFLVTILASKSNAFGLSKDVDGIRRAFASSKYSVRHCDPLEPPSYSDLAIHLELPAFGWAAWSTKNCLVVNPELYDAVAWNAYLTRFDHVVVKDLTALAQFKELVGSKAAYIPWTMPVPVPVPSPIAAETRNEFLWVIGASKNKMAYVQTLLRAWKPSYPPLHITSVGEIDLTGLDVLPNVSIRLGDIPEEERKKMRAEYKGHVCCSRAEGFGYTAAEAYAAGAFMILNSLPCYNDTYETSSSVHFLPSALERKYFDASAPAADLQAALDAAMAAFQKKRSFVPPSDLEQRWAKFRDLWRGLVPCAPRPASMKFLPPKLDNYPPISVVTLIYNRKKFFDLACHSMMITDYPKDKIEWVIVDDSDDPAEQNSDKIVQVGEAAAPMKFVYVPLKKKTPVSEKRNLGTAAATNDIVLFVDDDDHYPETSFRRRVAWLTQHPWKPRVVATTTIACYDLIKGISAVNVPPPDIPMSQRISEATLTFYKSFWTERGFPKGVLVGEGEGFIQGRESECLEMPPQQIIVAFSHGKNVSSRRVPSDADVKPGCFWGFPKEFLIFVHGLAGINIVDA